MKRTLVEILNELAERRSFAPEMDRRVAAEQAAEAAAKRAEAEQEAAAAKAERKARIQAASASRNFLSI